MVVRFQAKLKFKDAMMMHSDMWHLSGSLHKTVLLKHVVPIVAEWILDAGTLRSVWRYRPTPNSTYLRGDPCSAFDVCRRHFADNTFVMVENVGNIV
jgi:hypothetical protein